MSDYFFFGLYAMKIGITSLEERSNSCKFLITKTRNLKKAFFQLFTFLGLKIFLILFMKILVLSAMDMVNLVRITFSKKLKCLYSLLWYINKKVFFDQLKLIFVFWLVLKEIMFYLFSPLFSPSCTSFQVIGY